MRTIGHSPTIYGLDALRGFAALGVVLLHACVPYLQHPMPGLTWAVVDQPSLAVDILFWSIEIFIMPLFLVTAGFFTYRSIGRRTTRDFLVHRARRLLVPFAFGCLVLLPITIHLWVLGWVIDEIVPLRKLRSLKFDGIIDQHLWGTSHLWFLQYLFLYSVILAIAYRSRHRITSLGCWHPLKLAAGLFVIAVIILVVRPEVVWGFQHDFVPVPSKFAYSGLFFCAGLLVASHGQRLLVASHGQGGGWVAHRGIGLACSALAFLVIAVAMGRRSLGSDDSSLAERVLLATFTVSAATLITGSIFAWAIQFQRKLPRWITYLSRASFWIYLIHHSVLALVQIDLKRFGMGMSPSTKTAISFLFSVGFALLTYELLIRHTKFGRFLGLAEKSTQPHTEKTTPRNPAISSQKAA